MKEFCDELPTMKSPERKIEPIGRVRIIDSSFYPKCKNCGEHVVAVCLNDYVYKMKYRNNTIYFCGWNCMRKWQRERGLTPEQISEKNRIDGTLRGEHFCDTQKEKYNKRRK